MNTEYEKHDHDWHLSSTLPAEFDPRDDYLYVYESCEWTDGYEGHCHESRVTTFALSHVEREDGMRLNSLDVDESRVLDEVAERINCGEVVREWWMPYGGVGDGEKLVHVYVDGEDWYAVFEFASRSVSGSRY